MAENNKSRKHKNSRKSMKYLPFAVILFAVALIVGLSGFFRLSDIVITGAELYSEEEIIEASGLEIGNNLLFFSESGVRNKITKKLSYAGDVSVNVIHPSTVEIQMNESIGIASISTVGYYWIIDTDGKILEQTDLNGAADAISVTGINIVEPKVGDIIKADNNTKKLYLIDLIQAIHENGADDKITEIDITSIANIKFDYEGRFTVNYGDGGDEGEKFNKMVDVVNSQLEPGITGTIEFDDEGNVHLIRG